MRTFIQDTVYGIRLLVKNPGFSIVAVVALTLGIGANTAIFSVVNAVLLRPLPYDDSARLVFLSERSDVLEGMSIAYPNFTDWRQENQVFEKIGVYRRQNYNLTGSGEPERLTGGQVSADLLTALRVKPSLGRLFTDDEDKPGATPVVVLGDPLWKRLFGGDPKIIDQTITLDGRAFTVIGVMPSDYRFPSRADMWTPVGQEAKNPGWESRGNHPGLYGIARLKPGVTLEQARADMENIAVGLEQRYKDSNTGNRVTITPMLEAFVDGAVSKRLYVLLGAVGFVLLIACANVANLLLARGTARQKEIAIRVALGASRWRIMRQLLTESVLLSVLGGGSGLLLAKWGVRLLVAISPTSIPRSREIDLDARVLLFTFAVSVLTGVVFGVVPALQASKPDLNEVLKDAGRGSTGRRHLLRSGLVVAEVAFTVVLLIGAGLMIRSFYRLQQVDPGFVAENLLTFNLSLPQRKYPEREQRVNFYQQLLQNLRGLPGVESVGMATGLPLGNNGWQSGFWPAGRPDPPQGQRPLTEVAFVNPDYFTTMKMTLLRGRGFTEQDVKPPTPPGAQRDPQAPPERPTVTIIDEEFANRYWPDSDPVGQQISFWGGNVTVVGVIRRVKMEGLNADSNRVQSYYPYAQLGGGGMSIVMRTTGDPISLADAARQQVLSIDQDQPVYGMQTMGQIRSDSIAPDRLNLTLLTIFASLALVLAAVGIYGVMAYSVTQRTHEIGIRMALGARGSTVLGMVVGQGMRLIVIGLGLGLAGAFWLTSLMTTLLFGIGARDPMTFAGIAGVIGLVSFASIFIPARRATKVDPMVALRYE
ncbi:MAG TPA: ABC transporter permease [Blastocatellia bacterium]|nr:ABC transporter permease [Blastocatellia bacterium]